MLNMCSMSVFKDTAHFFPYSCATKYKFIFHVDVLSTQNCFLIVILYSSLIMSTEQIF